MMKALWMMCRMRTSFYHMSFPIANPFSLSLIPRRAGLPPITPMAPAPLYAARPLHGLSHLLAQPKNSLPAGANYRLPGASKGNRLPSPASLRRDRRRSSKWTHFERRRAPPFPRRAAPTSYPPNDSGPALCRPLHGLKARLAGARNEQRPAGAGTLRRAAREKPRKAGLNAWRATRAVLKIRNSSFVVKQGFQVRPTCRCESAPCRSSRSESTGHGSCNTRG